MADATRALMEELLAELEERRVGLGGGLERIQKQHEGGKMTARERMSFVELMPFAEPLETPLMQGIDAPADGVITATTDMAAKVGAPIIGLNGSAGARIQEGVDSLSGYGECSTTGSSSRSSPPRPRT